MIINLDPRTSTESSNEITLKDLFLKISHWFTFLKSHIFRIAIVAFFGSGIGFIYAWLQPVIYSAKLIFLVEESKSGVSNLGNIASLAGQFGVDVGGSSGGGVLSGDNIIYYLKSRDLSREVLVSTFDSSKNLSFADVYASVYKLQSDWRKSNKFSEDIKFQPKTSTHPIKYTRLQDSLIAVITDDILNNRFRVIKTDKKASFIEVTTNMENESLAKVYSERIVNEAVARYTNAKTERQRSTVALLEKRADSIGVLLSKKTTVGAGLQTTATTMDINPLYRTGTSVAVETVSRDKSILVTIFGEIIKNLELAKFTLSQETPVIQIVDSPKTPLLQVKVSKIYYSISLSIFFCFIFVIVISVKRFLLQ